MIIAIDFDGTIVEDCYPNIGTLRQNAKDIINKLHSDGHHIIIWTCRADQPLIDCHSFLVSEEIKFHQINESNPANVAKYGSDTRKVYADVYIDDKGIAGLPHWDDIYTHILKLKDKKHEKTKT